MTTIRHYADLDLRGSMIFGKPVNAYPVNPTLNEVVLIEGVLWMWTTIGGLTTWAPLTNKKNSYVHYQAVASLTWTINHGMNSDNFIYSAYDGTTGSPLSPSGLTNITTSGFTLTFTDAVAGHAVVFMDSEMFVPAINADTVYTNNLVVSGGVVTADNTGMFVNDQQVFTLNTEGQLAGGVL